MSQLQDNFGRRFHYLRMSVTDVCNFKCSYCLPDGYRPEGKPSFLTLSEIENLVAAFAKVGTRKVRITGGEPTLRKDFTDIIRAVADNSEIHTIATTTNGYRLEKHAKEWYDAGLRRINVSVDSLDPRMFYQITGENKFDEVMRGIDAALDAGFERVKINAVLLKDLNDKDLPRFLHWIKHTPIDLRFIELMETGLGHDYFKAHHLAGADIKARLEAEGWQYDQPRPKMARRKTSAILIIVAVSGSSCLMPKTSAPAATGCGFLPRVSCTCVCSPNMVSIFGICFRVLNSRMS